MNTNNSKYVRIYVVEETVGPALFVACSMLVSYVVYSSTLRSDTLPSSETSAYYHLHLVVISQKIHVFTVTAVRALSRHFSVFKFSVKVER